MTGGRVSDSGRVRAWRVAGLAVGLQVVGLLSVGALTAPAVAAGPQYCTDADQVTVVVDFQELGGGVVVRCADGAGSGQSGMEALTAAGFTFAMPVREPGMICRVAGRPAPTEQIAVAGDRDYVERCVDAPPTNAYWSYWSAREGGAWTYSTSGAGSSSTVPGGFEGWSFSVDALSASASDAPPPRVAPDNPNAPYGPAPTTPPPTSAPAPSAPPSSAPGPGPGPGQASDPAPTTPPATTGPATTQPPTPKPSTPELSTAGSGSPGPSSAGSATPRPSTASPPTASTPSTTAPPATSSAPTAPSSPDDSAGVARREAQREVQREAQREAQQETQRAERRAENRAAERVARHAAGRAAERAADGRDRDQDSATVRVTGDIPAAAAAESGGPPVSTLAGAGLLAALALLGTGLAWRRRLGAHRST